MPGAPNRARVHNCILRVADRSQPISIFFFAYAVWNLCICRFFKHLKHLDKFQIKHLDKFRNHQKYSDALEDCIEIAAICASFQLGDAEIPASRGPGASHWALVV